MGYVLGIDLGTTFTGAAVMRDGRAEIMPLGNHSATIPTMVFLREDDSLLIGDAAERRGIAEPARLAREFKRRLGDTAPIMLDRTPFSSDRLLGVMLKQLVGDIAERMGGPADVVAITHPANWGEYKIDLLRQAVQLAGVQSAVYLSEPVAAALQYAAGERVEAGEAVAVYDLGGGTFDAAVLRKTATGFELLGRPQGIERLGGIDFDEAVFAHVRKVVGDAIANLDHQDAPSRAALARLRQECVLAKESLSADSDATVPVLLPNLQTQVRITRVEFEDMIRPILRETIDSLRRAIDSAGVTASALKAVLLAGGSSRIPLVGDMVRSELGRPVVTDTHPKHSVALGAARYADNQRSAGVATVVAPVPPAPPKPPAPQSAPTVPPASTSRPAAEQPTVPVPVAPIAAATTAPTAPPTAPPSTPPTAPPSPPAKGRSKPAWIWAVAAAVVAALVIGAVVLLGGGDDQQGTDTTVETTAGSTETTGSGETTTSAGDTTTSVASDPSAATLAEYLTTDKPVADSLVGLYVPQVGAKYIGLDYEGVVWGAEEILTEHQGFRTSYGAILVDGGAYDFQNNGERMDGWYLSIVPQGFPTVDEANAWCTTNGLDASKCFGRMFKSPVDALANLACSDSSGDCVGIAAAVWHDDVLYVSYLVDGFEPNNSGVTGDFHVHFFFSTIPIENAGFPGSGPWYVWDLADGGGQQVFNGFNAGNLTDYGYTDGSSICITQAMADHSLATPDTYYCLPAPNPGQ